jgi:site-specific DNA recombinase
MANQVRMAGYVRVSKKAGREGASYISPTVQQEAIERWAAYKDIEIVDWFKDEDQSGGTQERPQLERAVALCLAGELDGIVSWKIDRFSRFTEGGLRDLRRLEGAGKRLAFVTEDIDTSGPMGKFVYVVMLAMAEYFLDNIKASWLTARERAVKRGAYVGRAPFGYERGEDGTIHPHPEHAPIMTEAFRLAAGGGLRPAMDYLQLKAPGRDWTPGHLRRLLASRAFLGDTRNGEFFQASTHAAIVTLATWSAAQTDSRPYHRTSDQYPLSGLLRCANCRGPMEGSRGGSRQRTYRCGNRCSAGAAITADNVEAFLQDYGREMLSGLHATISDVDDHLGGLESDMLEAEAELDAFAADLTARRRLGDKYRGHLEARADAVERARDAYQAHARQAKSQLQLGPPELLDAEDPQMFGMMLRSIFDEILVKRGRGMKVADRLLFIPLDADSTAGVAAAEHG